MVKLSVIIPVYNNEKYVNETIYSVLNQTYSDFELIIVDDGSTDNTLNILNNYKNNKKIKIFSQNHKGQAAALILGIKNSLGVYIAYLDSDDLCVPNRFMKQVTLLDLNPKIGLVYSDFNIIDSESKFVKGLYSDKPDIFRLYQENYIGRSTVIYRKSCLNIVGNPDKTITGNDDWDILIRIFEKYPFGYINESLVNYRVHNKNTSMIRPNKFDYERFANSIILTKAYYRLNKPFILRLKIFRVKFERSFCNLFKFMDKFPFIRIISLLNKIVDFVEYPLLRYTLKKRISWLKK